MEIFVFINRNPHIVVKPKDPKLESLDVYYHKGFKKFLLFEIQEDVVTCGKITQVVGKTCMNFRELYEHLLEATCETFTSHDSSGTEDNIEFKFPTTWPSKSKGQLFHTLDHFTDDSLKTLLLMLLT